MRLLFLGDMVGRSGREAVYSQLPDMIAEWKLDFVIVNGENAAGGFGITEAILADTINAGADVVTTGNHVWDQREALTFADRHSQFLRPANYPTGTPGRGADIFEARNGARVMVANIMGTVFMTPELGDPFRCGEKLLENIVLGRDADVIVVDFHAEATSEKICFAHFVDSRVTMVAGTHTHCPTADHQLLRGGTAYISDIGMCGVYDSSLGMDKEEPMQRFLTKIPKSRFEAAIGEATLSGVGLDVDEATGLARRIAPLRIGPVLDNARPW